MDAVFPFGLPGPTAFYEVLHVVTFTAHFAVAQFVVAGTLWLAALGLRHGPADPIAAKLRDWLPFALGAAITLGVAPLLFLQVLDKKSFYSANLLLGPRWMAILPALVLGFYLLYVAKSARAAREKRWLRAALPLAAGTCFAFTGWSWSENHLLAQHSAAWPGFFAGGAAIYRHAELAPRAATLACSALATAALGVAWLTRHENAAPRRRLTLVFLGGHLVMPLCAGLLVRAMPEPRLAAWSGIAAVPWLAIGAAAWCAELVCWLRPRGGDRWLVAATAGRLVSLLSISALREILRLRSVDLASLAPEHSDAFGSGGLVVFLAFAAFNGCVIVWCLRRVAR